MTDRLKIFAPATIANIGSGYDVMSLAVNLPGDIIEFIKRNDKKLIIHNQCDDFENMPLDPELNVTSYAMLFMMKDLKINQGFDIVFHQKIRPGSGLGSSAASSCAGVYALSKMMDLMTDKSNLARYASEGERLACGSPILDNVTSCLFGGISLIRSFDPIDIIQLTYPDELYVAFVHPHIEVLTEKARSVVPRKIDLELAIKQWANTAGLVAGLAQSDLELIARSTEDVVVEPHRKSLIEGFDKVKLSALKAGGLNCSISGAGPTLFSFCKDQDSAKSVSEKMADAFNALYIRCESYYSAINSKGIKIIDN